MKRYKYRNQVIYSFKNDKKDMFNESEACYNNLCLN